ncbi:kelch repeat-containing protein [Pelagicoccus mobilis]|uniref:Uncharacterized protein n=1 Tax=Pelagicoccus mobilis TaxID=415221 RepID=A0A934VP87_9BACT|nr:kelch repeat-containing protein [Pelagicoccus mobilis]MBK1877027.1 hypothetical protein [Pelagicoccus mobilis]
MNTNKWHNQQTHRRSINSSNWTKATVGLLTLVFTAFLQGQDLPFDSGSTGADGPLLTPTHPSNRQGHVVGYDETNNQYVLFGGYWSSTYYPETWVSDDPALGWTKVDTDTFVSGRSNSAMAWDYNSNRLIMFGGHRADGTKLNDMWAWDGSDWTEVDDGTPPPARYWHSLATDPVSKKMWVVAGRNASNQVIKDVWEWNGTAWTDLGNTGIDPSFNYSYERAFYDAPSDSIVLYSSWSQKTFRFDEGAWSELATASKPVVGQGFTIAWNSTTNSAILFGGSSDTGQTWEFKGDEWILLATDTSLPDRYNHGSAYSPDDDEVIVVAGVMDNVWNGTSNLPGYDTWSFTNPNWTYESGRFYYFDMTEKADGVWNFTTIDIPSGSEVIFTRNAANTPVVWLATGNVNINGLLRLDGENGKANDGSDNYALGGPGGAAGGLGAIRFDVSGNYAGTPGQGAGGGAPGVTSAQYGSDGNFRSTYGNTLLLPLVGGSGGGGGASSDNSNGGHGAGGGGAILIASDLDITVNGTINADGGDRSWGGASYGGDGSGGSIKLMADRLLGSGNLWARGGRSKTNEAGGRIRLEAFFRPLAAKASPPSSATAPIAAPDFGDLPSLTILSVDGENVAVPSTGNLQTPDVVFTAAGTVTIVVDSENIPEGTPVTLRITTSGEIINLPAAEDPDVTVGVDGTASFEAEVPAGLGTIQAFSEFTP